MKLKKISIFLILPVILLFLNGCPEQDIDKDYWDSSISIINNSNTTILHYFDFYNYPDTNLAIGNPFSDPTQLELALIKPNDSLVQEEAWLKYFEQPNTTKLMLFVIDKETVNNVSWDTVRKNYIVLKRYDLSLEDLEDMNWTITYP